MSPGNDGIAETFDCFKYDAKDKNEPFAELYNYIQEKKIDYVFVGNEQALADGISNYLEAKECLWLVQQVKQPRLKALKCFPRI